MIESIIRVIIPKLVLANEPDLLRPQIRAPNVPTRGNLSSIVKPLAIFFYGVRNAQEEIVPKPE